MPVLVLARLCLLEARRSGLPWLVLGALAVGVGLAGFLSRVALTESIALQTAVLGALLRACAVFLVAAHVTSSTLREINDKGLELMLSLPLPRAAHYLGRLAGHMATGVVIAACFALPLLGWASAPAVACWGLSLALEAALVAAATLFFAMTLAQFVPAIAATAGLYALARTIGTIQAITSGPLVEESFLQRIARFGVDAIALLLPRLDAVTRTEWLLYGAPAAGTFAMALAGMTLYIALLAAAGLFDFQRRGA